MYFLNIFLRSFLVLPLLLTHCRCWFIVAPDHLNDTHTHTHGKTPLDEGSARRRELYLTPHNTYKRQISMHPAGSEPANPASERPWIHALSPSGHQDRLEPHILYEKKSYTRYWRS